MPELRQSRATKDWVIVAKERAKRPKDFIPQKEVIEEPEGVCPFCPGNESKTPEESFAYRPSKSKTNDPNWELRIIPNKYAALIPTESVEREIVDNFYRKMDGLGIHEVIIETPEHNLEIPNMTRKQVETIFSAFRERYLQIQNDGRFSMVIIFRNHGVRAGTSISHPHSQLIATPIVPTHIRHLLEEATRYYDDRGSCVFCDTIETEHSAKSRLVLATKNFIVFHPFASIVPFETVIIPKKHNASFGDVSEDVLKEGAAVTQSVLKTLYSKLDDPAYNLIIRTAPFNDANEPFYHWYINIIPRLTTFAGFELGSGIHITTAIPEETAPFVRVSELDYP